MSFRSTAHLVLRDSSVQYDLIAGTLREVIWGIAWGGIQHLAPAGYIAGARSFAFREGICRFSTCPPSILM